MADNTILPPGSGGDTIRTMDRTTSKTQVVGLDFGPDAGPESLVSTSNGLPVAQQGTWTVAGTGSFTVAGTVAVSSVSGSVTTAPPTNASTNVTQFGGTNVVTGTGTSGAGIPRVTVSSDSFPATQPVSGTVTATQGGAPWSVKPDGTTWAQTGTSANVNVTNNPSVLTLDQTTSGTISAIDAVVAAPGGGGQMVSGSSTAGSLVALNVAGVSAWSMAITGGTFTTTIYFEGSLDSTTGTDGNWISLYGRILGTSGNANQNNATTNNTFFEGSCGGLKYIRFRAVGGAITTGPTITIRAGTVNTVSIGTPLPAGTNAIGGVNQGTANTLANAWPVELTDGTNGPAAVKAASTAAVAADKAVVVAVSPNNSVAVTGTFFQGTQPVSIAGTVAENLTQVASTALGTPQTFGTAPTGVVVGTSSDLYVAGTRARSNQTTTAAGVQDVNIVGSLGATNSVTNGTFTAITDNTTKVGVIAGTTALKNDMSSVAGTATVTAASGVQKVGISGNAAATLDAVITAATAPANGVATLSVNNTTAPSLTTGQSVALQCDYQGNQYITPYRRSNTAAATGTFTSTTATTLLAAQASGIFADLGSINITQGIGATANVYFSVNVSDGTATYKFSMFSNDSVTVTPTGSQPISMTFNPPIKATSAATAWTVALSSATDTPTVNVTATFWLQKAS